MLLHLQEKVVELENPWPVQTGLEQHSPGALCKVHPAGRFVHFEHLQKRQIGYSIKKVDALNCLIVVLAFYLIP